MIIKSCELKKNYFQCESDKAFCKAIKLTYVVRLQILIRAIC